MTSAKTIILLPVFNDWEAAQKLCADLVKSFNGLNDFWVLIVNDGSIEPIERINAFPPQTHILHLKYNLGHQKAIAVGLSFAYHEMPPASILVMDSDGDDRPEDAKKLINESQQEPSKIIVARRSRRKEQGMKRLLYFVYLLGFKLLTGKSIRSGNFCVLPRSSVKQLIYKGDIWLHLAGGIVKSGLPAIQVNTEKGDRYHGKSKMTFTSLFYHGIAALATFIDVIAIRLLVASIVAVILSLLALITVFIIRTATSLGIPGWASTLGATLIVIILISFLIALFLIFSFLSSQSYQKLIPGMHYKEFIDHVENPGHDN